MGRRKKHLLDLTMRCRFAPNFCSEMSRQMGGRGAGCALCQVWNSGEWSVQFLALERRNSIMASPKALPIPQNVLALPR
jgi:hypothetical protein